jgi:hypothetical protein
MDAHDNTPEPMLYTPMPLRLLAAAPGLFVVSTRSGLVGYRLDVMARSDEAPCESQ